MPLRFDFGEHLAIGRFMAKWALVLTPVAIVIGSVIAFFLWSLEQVTDLRVDHAWLLYLLPVAGAVIAALYHRFGREVEGGNNLVVDEIHEPGGGIPARITPLILFATDLTHLAGGSAGREGTAVQMGGGLAAASNRFFRLGEGDLRILLIAGVAAGFGAVFGTPIAGAVFALEVLTIGRMEYTALVPALYASLAADYVTRWWGIEHTAYAVALAPKDIHSLPFDPATLAKAVVAGIAFGLAALLFTELAHGAGRLFRHLIHQPILRPVAGGLIVIAMTYALGTRDYLGLGVTSPHPGATTIVSAFGAGGADPWAWWWKIAFTVLTLSSGFKGGEVTPLFFIGATLGNRMAVLLRAPVDLFAGLGFVAVFAGATNTPLACTIMGIELFGSGPAVYLAVACFVAYLVSGHRGIYMSQRLGTPKVESPGLLPEAQLRTIRALAPNIVERGRVLVRLTTTPIAMGGHQVPENHRVESTEMSMVRIYLAPRERRGVAGGRWRFRGRPLYQEIIDAAKQDGILNAVAHPTHYGYSGTGDVHRAGGPETANSHLMLCVELIAPTLQLETFCVRHGELLRGKVVVHKAVQHWDIQHAPAAALDLPAAAGDEDSDAELAALR